jgi:23S rRNA pseudouridine1911/1915/1917 synthase
VAAPGTRSLIVAESDDEARLDHLLARELPDLSRAQIQRLIKDGHIVVQSADDAAAHKRVPTKPGQRVSRGQRISVDLPATAPAAPTPENLPVEILFDDKDIVVINKPSGMVVHPAAGHASGTLVNALLHHVRGLSGIGGTNRPGIVHRLDKGTSGAMVVAKHDAAHRSLSQQFHDRTVTKDYLALVWGTLKAGQQMDNAIGRDPRHRTKMSTRGSRTRPALTTVTAAEALRGLSLATVRIGTGRTHQIRVHLSEAGHPIVGDDTYGGEKHHPPAHLRSVLTLKRPFLHAWRLSFSHPLDGRALSFEAPLPADLEALLAALRADTRRGS